MIAISSYHVWKEITEAFLVSKHNMTLKQSNQKFRKIHSPWFPVSWCTILNPWKTIKLKLSKTYRQKADRLLFGGHHDLQKEVQDRISAAI